MVPLQHHRCTRDRPSPGYRIYFVTGLNDTAFTRARSCSAVLALALVGAGAPAWAADPAGMEAVQPAQVDVGSPPAVSPLPDPADEPSQVEQPSAALAQLPPVPDTVAADGSVVVAAAEGPAAPVDRPLYGPPAPKAEKGRLPDLSWAPPPPQVPRALDDAIRIATRNYPTATAARASLRGAAADVRTAKWQRFPLLGLDTSFLDGLNPIPELTVELPLFTAGRIGAGIRQAEAREDVSSARYVETIEALALNTAQTYFQIMQLTRRQQLLAVSLVEHRKLVGTMERRVEQEVSPQADLELARSRTAQFEQEYNVATSQLDTALRVLAELIADPDYELGPIPTFNPDLDLPDRVMIGREAQAFDPALRRLAAEVDVARAEYDATKAEMWPRLNGQYSYTEIFGSRVGVVARLQTAPGLSQFSQNDSARLRIDTAVETRRQAVQQLARQIDSDLIEFDAARARASISSNASDTASRVALSYMRQFIAGRRSWLDVMNALREAVNAEIGKSDAEVTAMAASVRLLLRSGRWRPFFEDGAQSGD
jgi:adhesin transport system outer membrane protein